jgi:hypothetical protein
MSINALRILSARGVMLAVSCDELSAGFQLSFSRVVLKRRSVLRAEVELLI